MRSVIVIPARFASTRLPGKPLLKETGKYLIQHVWEQACRCRAERVIVATDDENIRRAVASFGGEARLTRADHPTGTDRIAEVARDLEADVIVNIQGDEPEIEPAAIDRLIELLAGDAGAVMSTLAVPFRREEDWRNPNCVKVVCDGRGRALYFSRSPIPHVREGAPDFGSGRFLHHLGLYAYRREFLLQLASWPPEPVEHLEKLEQLRVLARGYALQVGVVSQGAKGVDTPEDYRAFVERWRGARSRAA